MNFRAEHLIKGITLADFERLFFDEEFNIALCRALKLDRVLVKREEKDGVIARAVRVGPEREIPAPVAKVLGAVKIEYTEYLDYKFGSYRGTWKTVSSLMTDKVDSSGTFSFRAQGDGVLRLVEGEVKVRVFGLGSIVERFIVADVERSYQNAAQFTEEWIAKR